MYVAKKFIIKFALSLTAGVASTIRIGLVNTAWDKCSCGKTCEIQKQAFT